MRRPPAEALMPLTLISGVGRVKARRAGRALKPVRRKM